MAPQWLGPRPDFRKIRTSMTGPKPKPWPGIDRNEFAPLKTMSELKSLAINMLFLDGLKERIVGDHQNDHIRQASHC